MALTEEEIKRRLQHERNLEMLHQKARERVLHLEAENKLLKQRIKELEDQNDDQNRRIDAMAYELEQVKIKLFGKKPLLRLREPKEKKERDTASYRRPIPQTITEMRPHPVSLCFHCNKPLTKKRTAIFFEEDVPLPTAKIVIKHEVEVGYCTSCKRQSSGYPIPSKKVVLGEKVRKYVCVLSIANRLSHSQIHDHLNDVFGLHLSLGEIDRILTKEAQALAQLKASLRKNKEKYFTFLDHPGIPLDNNKAERALRHLVIKRRTSFGSKTQRGAETTSILASVILFPEVEPSRHVVPGVFSDGVLNGGSTQGSNGRCGQLQFRSLTK